MKSLNILYSMLCRDFHDNVIKSINKKLNIGFSLAVTECYTGDVAEFDRTFECGEVYHGYYYRYKEYAHCPPVDDNLIELMKSHDIEILKMMDRHQSWRWNFEDRMQVYYEHIRFWSYILDCYKINTVVFMNVPHEVFDYVIYCLCKIKNINTFVFLQAPIFYGRSVLCTDFLKDNLMFQDYYKEFIKKKVVFSDEVIEKYNGFRCMKNTRKKEKRWWSGATTKENNKYMSYMDVRKFFETESYNIENKHKNINNINPHWLGFLCRLFYIKNKYMTNKIWKYYERIAETPCDREKYIYYALHYQPEATSAPQGGGIYSNQLLPIQILASCLPVGYKLYVKEHPAQTHVGRYKTFYNRIKKIKNVRLITGKEDTYELLKNAVATASLTGTIAVESVTNGIPCILFGQFYYNQMEGVYHVRTYHECKMILDKIAGHEIVIDQNKVKAFFQAIYEYSSPVNVGYEKYDEIENSKSMVDLLCSAIG